MIFLPISLQMRWDFDSFLSADGVFDILSSIYLTIFIVFLRTTGGKYFKEIQKLAYGALQNQVQERITSDDQRIEYELIARRDIMKIKFNLKVENMMFSIAMQSEQLPPVIKEGNEKSEKILELWNLQQQSPGKFIILI